MTMIEKCAKAAADEMQRRYAEEQGLTPWLWEEENNQTYRDDWLAAARAALLAIREPDEAMMDAADSLESEEIWREMIDTILAEKQP